MSNLLVQFEKEWKQIYSLTKAERNEVSFNVSQLWNDDHYKIIDYCIGNKESCQAVDFRFMDKARGSYLYSHLAQVHSHPNSISLPSQNDLAFWFELNIEYDVYYIMSDFGLCRVDSERFYDWCIDNKLSYNKLLRLTQKRLEAIIDALLQQQIMRLI